MKASERAVVVIGDFFAPAVLDPIRKLDREFLTALQIYARLPLKPLPRVEPFFIRQIFAVPFLFSAPVIVKGH